MSPYQSALIQDTRRNSDLLSVPHCRAAALAALGAYPGGLHVGGGVTPENAGQYLDAGASHVIVTSYVFRNGRLEEDRLNALVGARLLATRKCDICRVFLRRPCHRNIVTEHCNIGPS